MNILASVFATLVLGREGSFLSGQQFISVFINLELSNDDLRGVDGNVDGLSIELLLGELFNVDAPSKSVYLGDLTLVTL